MGENFLPWREEWIALLGAQKWGGNSGWGGRLWGEGRPEAHIKCPPPPQSFPMPAVGGLATLVLTSASFQSPGMQKDSSRSLPHSSKIRSSEEGTEFAEGACEDLGSTRLSAAFPNAPRSPPRPPGLPCTPAPWCVQCRSFCSPLPQLLHRPPCLLWEELLRGGYDLLGLRGFWGQDGPSL